MMTSLDTSASVSSLLDAVHQIEPVIHAHAEDAERERRLPDATAKAMRECGLYRLWRPKAFGGLELDPMTAFQVIEEVSRIDSAAGWNLQLSSAIDAIGAWFPDEGAKAIYGEPDSSFGGSFFPPRRAVAVEGGYRLDGRTPFVSGAHQAHWFLGLAHVYDGDTQRLSADGTPVTLLTMCPAIEAVIVDNWRTLGIRGTGSHDVAITDVFVPLSHTAVLAPYETPGSAYEGPACINSPSGLRYRFWRHRRSGSPGLPSTTCWSSARKTPAYLATPLRDRTPVQAAIGETEATLGAGRAYLYEALREIWEKALEGHLIDMPGKTEAAACGDLRRSRCGESCRPRAQGRRRHRDPR